MNWLKKGWAWLATLGLAILYILRLRSQKREAERQSEAMRAHHRHTQEVAKAKDAQEKANQSHKGNIDQHGLNNQRLRDKD